MATSIVAILILVFLPAIVVGFPASWTLLLEQFSSLRDESTTRSLCDIAALFNRLEWPKLGHTIQVVVGIFTLLLFPVVRFVFSDSKLPFDLWYSFGMSAILLLNPRTETPTFVFIAPAYVFLVTQPISWIRFASIVAMWSITFIYTAVWRPFFHFPLQAEYASKTLGTLLLWILSGYLLSSFVLARRRTR